MKDGAPYIVMIGLVVLLVGSVAIGVSEIREKRKYEYCLEQMTSDKTIEDYKECIKLVGRE